VKRLSINPPAPMMDAIAIAIAFVTDAVFPEEDAAP